MRLESQKDNFRFEILNPIFLKNFNCVIVSYEFGLKNFRIAMYGWY